MNQVSFNGIQENFYAAKSAMGSFLGKTVSVIKENPNAVVAAIIVLAAIAIVGATVKCYRAYNSMKNEVSNLKNQNEALKSQNNLAQKLVNYVNVESEKTEDNLIKVNEDVKGFTAELEVQNKEIKSLKDQIQILESKNINLITVNTLVIAKFDEMEKQVDELNNQITELKKTPQQKLGDAITNIKERSNAKNNAKIRK